MKKWVLLVALLVAQGGQAQSFYKNGNDLLKHCEADKEDPIGRLHLSHCVGYIGGVSDLYGGFVGSNLMKPVWCLPKGVVLSQLHTILLKYLKENPQDLHHNAGSLVAAALFNAFPCE